MSPNRKFLLITTVLFVCFCLTNKVASQKEADEEYEDDYYLDNELYDDNYNDVEVIKFVTKPPKTKATTKASTTEAAAPGVPETTSTEKPPLPINLMDQIANAIEVAEEDNFDTSLNEKVVEIVKEPVEDEGNNDNESDLVYDDREYGGEVYDEGEPPVETKAGVEQSSGQTVKIAVEEEDAKDDESKEMTVVKEDGAENKLGNAAQVRVDDTVENKKTGFDLKKAYVIIPVASVLLVSMVLGTLLLLVKRTNVFKKKSTPAAGTRKQIYKSVDQQDPVV